MLADTLHQHFNVWTAFQCACVARTSNVQYNPCTPTSVYINIPVLDWKKKDAVDRSNNIITKVDYDPIIHKPWTYYSTLHIAHCRI